MCFNIFGNINGCRIGWRCPRLNVGLLTYRQEYFRPLGADTYQAFSSRNYSCSNLINFNQKLSTAYQGDRGGSLNLVMGTKVGHFYYVAPGIPCPLF